MKPQYTPLSKLTEESNRNNFKIKVKVIQKSDTRQTPPKVPYQKLLLRDDEGTTMKGTIFGDDIKALEYGIERGKTYEISNVKVKSVPEQYRGSGAAYQLNFSDQVNVMPLTFAPSTDEPNYQKLIELPRSQDDYDDLIDTVAVVLYVSDVRTVKRGDSENSARDIFLVDGSTTRPVKLTAWSEFATKDIPLYKAWPEGFMIVGFIGLRPLTYQGYSLLTTLSTSFVHEPVGEKFEEVRSWANENGSLLEDWRGKAILLANPDKRITKLEDIIFRKPTSIWPEESFWVKVCPFNVAPRDVFYYVGCSECGRKNPGGKIGQKFVCPGCKSKTVKASARVLVHAYITDGTGSVKVTAFGQQTEQILNMSAEQIAALKTGDNIDALSEKLEQVNGRECLLHIAPTSKLALNNILYWNVRDVDQGKPVEKGSASVEALNEDAAATYNTAPNRLTSLLNGLLRLNTDMLAAESWTVKATMSKSVSRDVTSIKGVMAEQANSPQDVGTFWVEAKITSICERDVHCYVGCNLCSRKVSDSVGDKIDCITCKHKPAVAAERVLLNAQVSDDSGTLDVVAFSGETELIFGMKADQIVALKLDTDSFAAKLEQLKAKEMLLQISLKKGKSKEDELKWVVRSVEAPPEDE